MPIVPQNQQGVLSSGTGSNYLFDAPRVGDMTQFKLIVAGEATPKYHPNYTLPGVAGIAWSLDGDTWGVDGAPLSGLHINMAGIDIFAKCVSVQASVRTVTIDSSGLIDDLLGGVIVMSPVLNLALTAFAPTVTASAPNVSVAVPTLGLSTTMHVPSITASTPNTNVDVPKLGLTVTVHAPTITAIIALRVPSNLVLIPGDSIIDASWDAADHATGYQVRINSGTWVDIGTALTHQFTGLTNGVSATINVRAYNADGVGPMATASATPEAVPAGPDTYWFSANNGAMASTMVTSEPGTNYGYIGGSDAPAAVSVRLGSGTYSATQTPAAGVHTYTFTRIAAGDETSVTLRSGVATSVINLPSGVTLSENQVVTFKLAIEYDDEYDDSQFIWCSGPGSPTYHSYIEVE